MRVMLACAAFPPFGRGGGPVASELLARSLARNGAEVRVIVVGDAEGMECRDGVEIVTLSPLNVYRDNTKPNPLVKKIVWHLLENFNPWAFSRMRDELSRFNPDAVVTISTENINVATWAAAHAAGIPCVHVAQSYILMCRRGSLFRNGENCDGCLSCKIMSVGKRYLTRYVDALVTETQFLQRAHLDAGYFRDVAHYVIPGAPEAAEEKHQAKPEGLRVGYIGTLTRNKGIDTLADAANRLACYPDIRFVIAGTGDTDYTTELKARFPRASTRFVGWVRPADFYSVIDTVVVPSVWREPFGRASIEGTSFGVPALVARSGGLPENVTDGVDGLIFEPRDDKTLAELLARMAADPAFHRSLADGALTRARSYSLQNFGVRIAECLREVIDQKRLSHSQVVCNLAH
jgi:glycosyltransferase involved in cell wall biosynthesis